MEHVGPGLFALLPLAIAGLAAVVWILWVRRVTNGEDSRARWRYRDWSDPDD